MCRDDACTDFVCRTGFWYVFEVGQWVQYQCGTVQNPRTCEYPSRLSSPTTIFSKVNQVFSPGKHDPVRTQGPIYRNNFCEDYNECDETQMHHNPRDNPGKGYSCKEVLRWLISNASKGMRRGILSCDGICMFTWNASKSKVLNFSFKFRFVTYFFIRNVSLLLCSKYLNRLIFPIDS